MTDSAREKKLAKLTAMRAAFADGLPERLAAMAACWRAQQQPTRRNQCPPN